MSETETPDPQHDLPSGRRSNSADLLAGILLMVLGSAATIVAIASDVGTASRMGPGFFPFALGLLLALLGCVLTVRGAIAPSSGPLAGSLKWRPITFILIGILAFGGLVRPFGLAPAIVVLIILSRFASRERSSTFEWIALVVGLTAIPILIFVYGLGMPLRIWDIPWN